MRWYWIDRFVEFESGQRAVAVKSVSLSEDHLTDYMSGYPIMPHPLIVEGIAQTAGLLVGQVRDFREKVILAKIGRATFHRLAMPGDRLEYTVTIEDVHEHGAIIKGESRVDGELQCELDIFFAHLDDRFEGVQLFPPADFLAMLRTLGVFDIGRNRDGSPLQPPQYLLDAERQFQG